jgi:hypothetical protein
MKLLTGFCVLASLLGVSVLWKSDEVGSFIAPISFVTGGVLGTIALTGVALWLRSRRRKQVMSLKDSALW